jgi:hypothetical protein
VQNDSLETQSERAAWQKGYDIGLAHEGDVPPIMHLGAMRDILARPAPPRNEKPGQHQSETTGARHQQGKGPFLDLTDPAVKRIIELAKRWGYITYAELDEALPPEELTVEQIEDVLDQLSEHGISVREADPPMDRASRPNATLASTAPEQPSDGPLFHRYRANMSVRRLIRLGQKRGYVTDAELNLVLRPQRFTSNQIQDVLRQFAKLGINTVSVEEAEETLLARSSPQNDVPEEPEGGPLIPLIREIMNDQSLSEGEKRAFALGLLRGLAARAE